MRRSGEIERVVGVVHAALEGTGEEEEGVGEEEREESGKSGDSPDQWDLLGGS